MTNQDITPEEYAELEKQKDDLSNYIELVQFYKIDSPVQGSLDLEEKMEIAKFYF